MLREAIGLPFSFSESPKVGEFFPGLWVNIADTFKLLTVNMAHERVLIVDDEELNLFIIQEFLESESLTLDAFADPVAAWESLVAPGSDYDLVVLDRMMPDLDGMEFLRRMKAEARFTNIPVIMQTAASSPEQVREGLAAGAYYYLTKPYEPEALISIVRGALEDRRSRQQLLSQSAHAMESSQLLHLAEFQFSTLAHVESLVPVLASLCPNPETVAPGLADLMVNAIEHGNLELSYQEKARLKWDGNWEEEIARRAALPEYADRIAVVRVERQSEPTRVVYTVSDEGPGFEWHRFLEFDPERAYDPNGRGIAMARMISFSTLEYRGCGNQVVATVLCD